MGNRLACCRQHWSHLDDTDNEVFAEETHHSNLCFRNSAAVTDEDAASLTNLWRFPNEPPASVKCDIEHYPFDSGKCFTQHISEREPDDTEFDPSLNASRPSLFISDVTNTLRKICCSSSVFPLNLEIFKEGGNPRNKKQSDVNRPRRWSSCSTVFIGAGCMVTPHQETTLWGVAIAIEFLIRGSKNMALCLPLSNGSHPKDIDVLSRMSTSSQIYDDAYRLFDERNFPVGRCSTSKFDRSSLPNDSNCFRSPDASDIHRFLCDLFSISLLGPQCAIVALILLERLMNAAEVGLFPWSWRRQLLACLLVASKVLDDQAVWNTDYCQILKDLSVEDLNALERHTLSLLQFNIDVPLSVYARYYFDLLAVSEARGMANHHWERRRLTPDLARQLRLLPPWNSITQACDISELNTRLLFDLPRGTGRSDKHVPMETLNKKYPSTTSKHIHLERSTGIGKPDQYQNIRPSGIYPKQRSLSVKATTEVSFNLPKEPGLNCSHQPSSSESAKSVDDEGPLVLDEETEYVNTLAFSPPSERPSSKGRLKSNLVVSKSRGQRCLNSQAMATHSSHHVPIRFGTLSNFEGTSRSPNNHTPYYPCNSSITRVASTNGPGIMRSILGGEVAYSLLRDAGMF